MIKDYIEAVLQEANIEYAFLERELNKFPFVVYTYQENTGMNADNIEEVSEYDIYINLYAKIELDRNIETLKKCFEHAYFRKIAITPPIKVKDSDFYQQALHYKKTK